MKKIYRFIGIITLYIVFAVIYIVLFLFGIMTIPLFFFLTIGSVTVLSTGTVYTVVQSRGTTVRKKKINKQYQKGKPIKKKSTDLIEDYYETIPLINEYINSKETYEDIQNLDSYIFSIFSQEELNKIELLKLSKMDKIYFIREMMYFDAEERGNLIEDMLKYRDIIEKDIVYTPPSYTIGMGEKVRVYVRSLTEPGEKTKTITIETSDLISSIIERVGILFEYRLGDFLLSSGGILLNDDLQIKDYDINEDDEIAIIPTRKEK